MTHATPRGLIKHDGDLVDAIPTPGAKRDRPTITPKKILTFVATNVATQKIYRKIRARTGVLGGNGYDGAIYGELTMMSLQKVIMVLVEKSN